MAHFNPAVTIGYLITGHLRKNLLACYFGDEIIGALLTSVIVKYAIGTEVNLGANAPNYNFSLPFIFGVEVSASVLLMAVIYAVVLTKGLRGFSGIAIGRNSWIGYVLLRIRFRCSNESSLFFGSSFDIRLLWDLWLYWTATFVGTSLVALVVRKKKLNPESAEN